MQWKWLFLSQSKFFNQTSHRKTKQIQKTKCEKSFVKLTEKYLKIEGYVNVYCGKMFVRNYFSGCSEVLSKINCYQQNESVSHEFFPSKHPRSNKFTWSGKASTSLLYYAYLSLSTKTTGLS